MKRINNLRVAVVTAKNHLLKILQTIIRIPPESLEQISLEASKMKKITLIKEENSSILMTNFNQIRNQESVSEKEITRISNLRKIN
jgi:hypothetical protein